MDNTIRTERLLLRPLTPGDLHTAHAYAGDAALTRYMVYLPNETIEETAAFLRRAADEWAKVVPSFYEYAVTLGGRHIGAVSVYLDDSRQEGELGWILLAEHQGHGYAVEAARAVMDFAVRTLGVGKIAAHCDARNEPSVAVMRKLGLTLERSDKLRHNKGDTGDVPELKYSLTIV